MKSHRIRQPTSLANKGETHSPHSPHLVKTTNSHTEHSNFQITESQHSSSSNEYIGSSSLHFIQSSFFLFHPNLNLIPSPSPTITTTKQQSKDVHDIIINQFQTNNQINVSSSPHPSSSNPSTALQKLLLSFQSRVSMYSRLASQERNPLV